MRDAIRWFKCKLKPPKNPDNGNPYSSGFCSLNKEARFKLALLLCITILTTQRLREFDCRQYVDSPLENSDVNCQTLTIKISHI